MSRVTPQRPEASAQSWADEINGILRPTMSACVQGFIDAGCALIDAKEGLGFGEWGKMFAGHPQAVASPIPFTQRTGHRLMTIAKHQILTDRTHASVLPPSWMTLYELTKLPDAVLEKALADRLITPGLQRREVGRIRHTVTTRKGAELLHTEPATESAKSFRALRDEALARPDFAGRMESIRRDEREAGKLRQKVQKARERLSQDVVRTVEAEAGPIRYVTTVREGVDAGQAWEHGREEVALAVLPYPGEVQVIADGYDGWSFGEAVARIVGAARTAAGEAAAIEQGRTTDPQQQEALGSVVEGLEAWLEAFTARAIGTHAKTADCVEAEAETVL
ncbi:MAG: hypothetical protein ACREMB_07910 [Candidatus Rokuibacteriota bacterium]